MRYLVFAVLFAAACGDDSTLLQAPGGAVDAAVDAGAFDSSPAPDVADAARDPASSSPAESGPDAAVDDDVRPAVTTDARLDVAPNAVDASIDMPDAVSTTDAPDRDAVADVFGEPDAECQPGDQGCDGDRIKVCNVFGQWVTGPMCQFGCFGAGMCADVFFPDGGDAH